MTLSFLYTEAFDYECAECGFCAQSEKPLDECPACGSSKMAIRDAALNPLRDFVSKMLVEVPEKGFWVAKVPVVQMVWRLVMGGNPSRFKGDELPVESVSERDCADFISKMNLHPIVVGSGYVFRLPTSAEWSLFARRGRRKFNNIAWSWGDSDGSPHPVATKSPNPLGLYDLWGNIWEWCSDVDDNGAICRGGCWCCDEAGCMEEERWPADTRCSFIGFRLCAERKA